MLCICIDIAYLPGKTSGSHERPGTHTGVEMFQHRKFICILPEGMSKLVQELATFTARAVD
jgi:hypothetical protein